ncbi:MAG: DUF2779 domain-containing protein [Burkholderiaceae bacterium]
MSTARPDKNRTAPERALPDSHDPSPAGEPARAAPRSPLRAEALFALRHCARRLWLSVRRSTAAPLAWQPESRAQQASVLAAARRRYDPDRTGLVIGEGGASDADRCQALAATRRALLDSDRTDTSVIFGAVMAADGIEVRIDCLVADRRSALGRWRLGELALQARIARLAGMDLSGVSLAHLNARWVRPVDDDESGLLLESDITTAVAGREPRIERWIAAARDALGSDTTPQPTAGRHCDAPRRCEFRHDCPAVAPDVEFPVAWLPAVQRRSLREHLADPSVRDLRDLPDALLDADQRRVKTHTLAATRHHDRDGARRLLDTHPEPACFIDFEAIAAAVPPWPGMRPFQPVPFQFSCHRVDDNGRVVETAFLALGRDDPSRPFALALIAACGDAATIYVYDQTFERARIRELAERFADLREALSRIDAMLVDLHPIVKAHFYDPSQHGRWSLKAVLAAIAPELAHTALDGVRSGIDVQHAWLEAVDDATTASRRREIEAQLLAYCRLDSFGLLRIRQALRGDPPSATHHRRLWQDLDIATETAVTLIETLRAALGAENILVGAQIGDRHRGDWLMQASADVEPIALALPRDTAGVSAVLRACNAARVAVVPQGGLTGLTGGAIPVHGAVLLSLERLRAIEEVDPIAGTITVQAGVALQSVQEAADALDMLFPLDIGGRGSCQIGGNLSTNAGGNRVLRYGMARELVLGIEAVLADGTVVSSMNKMLKNNAGYDLKQLFIGSEGTLGVITRAVLRLFPKPITTSTALCAFDDFEQVYAFLRAARSHLGGTLSAFELMWAAFYSRAVADRTPPLPTGHIAYVLVESMGTDPTRDGEHFSALIERAIHDEVVVDAVVAQSIRETRQLWAVRDMSGELVQALAPVGNYDVSIPTARIQAFALELDARLKARWPGAEAICFGHLADSNLHLFAKVDERPFPEHELDEIVFGTVRDWQGSISAEHGIGLLKKNYLDYSRSAEEIALMRRLRAALDPNAILNPGKVF